MGLNSGNQWGDGEDINAEINVTPLIDVMLVLLIIFMVTSSVSLESGLEVDLPAANTTSSGEAPNAVILTLAADGRISVQGQLAANEELEELIRRALASEKTSLVILEGDRAADLGAAVAAMDVARQAGATQFAIAAQQAP